MRYTQDYKAGTEGARYVAFSSGLIDGFAPFYGAATPSLDITPTQTCATGNATGTTAAQVAANCANGVLAPGVTSKGIIGPNGIITRHLGDSSGALTGGAGAEWTPTPDIFLYARYNRGYEELTYNAGFVSIFPEVGPEFINSYEVGYKQAFGHSASIDIAGFYYDYIGLQLPISVSNNGLLQTKFINVPSSTSAGVEFEGTWSPITDLLLTATYSYDYTAINTACAGTGVGAGFVAKANALCLIDSNDPNGINAGAKPVGGPAGGVNQSIKGDALPNAPRNKFAVNVAYTWHFDPGNLTASVSYVWRDRQFGSVFTRRYDSAPSWDDVDFRALWKGPNDKYEIIGFVKNIFNTQQYETGDGGAGLLGTATTHTTATLGLNEVNVFTLAPPRTYGLEVRYKFF